MPDDTGAHGAIADSEAATSAHRRGPLRPERLQSVRNRVSGAGLARLFQAGDATGLVLASVVASQFMALPEVMWLGAPALALVLLVATGAYSMNTRERLRRRLGRLLIAAAAAGGGAGTVCGLIDPTFPAIGCAAWVAAAAMALFATHSIWMLVLRRLRALGQLTPNLIIVGGTAAAQRLIRRALKTRDVNILGVFDDRRERVEPATESPVRAVALGSRQHHESHPDRHRPGTHVQREIEEMRDGHRVMAVCVTPSAPDPPHATGST